MSTFVTWRKQRGKNKWFGTADALEEVVMFDKGNNLDTVYLLSVFLSGCIDSF